MPPRCLVLLTSCVLAACSGGGGGSGSAGGGGGGGGAGSFSAATWNGTWVFELTPTASTCSGIAGPLSDTAEITLSSDGTTVTLGQSGVVVPVSGGVVQGYSTFNATGYDLRLTSNDTIAGTQTTNIPGFPGSPACTITYDFAAVRVTAVPASMAGGTAFDWSGRWELTEVPATRGAALVDDVEPGERVQIRIEPGTDGAGTDGMLVVDAAGARLATLQATGDRLHGFATGMPSHYDLVSVGPEAFVGTRTVPLAGLDGRVDEAVLLLSGVRRGR